VDAAQQKRRQVRRLQKYVVNPPTKLAVGLGLVPGHALVETVGRKTGRRRRTVVGVHRDGGALYVVTEQGRHAGYVRNIEAQPRIRVRLGRRWYDATARLLDDDDVDSRLESFGRPRHARLVRQVGTALTTLRIDLAE
jgi:deazaflavin-dependent oxidoreductase (nitroreductase family)